MKRKLFALTPVVLLLLLVLAFVKFELLRGADWQIALDEFIAQSQSPSHEIAVQSMVRARRPWQFRPEMGVPVRNDWRWQVDQLPYPPIEVYCVLLEQSRSAFQDRQSPHEQQIAFIGHHSDTLWRVGWMIHEGPHSPFSEGDLQQLDLIGCDMNSDISALRNHK